MKRFWMFVLMFFGGGIALGEKEGKKLLVVKTLGEVKSLEAGDSEMEVTYLIGMSRKKGFVTLMKALARKEQVKHLKLVLPNSTHVKNEDLEVLRDFKYLERFTLNDSRDFGDDCGGDSL